MTGPSYGGPSPVAYVHNTGVQTERDATGTAWARSVCDCRWRGPWRHGEDCGARAARDSDEHRHHVGWDVAARVDRGNES